MKIKISGLRDGDYFYNFTANFVDIDIDAYDLIDNFYVNVKLTKRGSNIILNIIVNGILSLECDRCLDSFQYKFTKAFELIYKMNDNYYLMNLDNKEPDVFYIDKNSYEIDITEAVRDYILLSIPMKKVPDEKDGICLLCNRRIDTMFLRNEQKDETNLQNFLKIK
ncbi:MAG: DUF177 domain-containing protein [Ignavibacteria bacterium]|nr:DUF177 domain-containing protein [Ignavibacteria bacterium]